MKLDQLIEKGIYGLIPAYQPQKGNVTQIIDAQGNIYIDSRVVKTLLKILCKYYAVHLEHCREKYGKLIHQRLSVPLPLHKDLLLLPVKVRKPMFPKDGACGYINLHGIETIQGNGENTIFLLKNGMEIECLHRLRTVYQHVNNARLIAKHSFTYEPMVEEYGKLQELWELYEAPATKGDVLTLQREMLGLAKALKKVLEPRGGS